MFDIRETVDRWVGEGKQVALATVVRTWGSGPRREGAKMAITSDLQMVGSVSGGCVEGAVAEEAMERIRSGGLRLLDFGIANEDAWEVGLTCGGHLDVSVEKLDRDWWRAVSPLIAQDRTAVTVTRLDGPSAGAKLLLAAGKTLYATGGPASESATLLGTTARSALGAKKAAVVEDERGPVFVDVHRPRPRLILIGGAHVAQALQDLARPLGFRLFLVDPRQAFATAERFPAVERIFHSFPDQALPQLDLDEETYVAVLTHDPKIDDPALECALRSKVPYVGVLSSMKTHEKRLERLRERGLDEASLQRIHVPIGIDLGGRTPEEIALSILAEIVSVRNA